MAEFGVQLHLKDRRNYDLKETVNHSARYSTVNLGSNEIVVF
jgi:hypothetical protein